MANDKTSVVSKSPFGGFRGLPTTIPERKKLFLQKNNYHMPYTKVTVTLHPFNITASEVLVSLLGDIDYESFVETEQGFEAYIQTPLFSIERLDQVIIPMEDITFTYITEEIPDQNWNEEWEKNYFQPIIIDEVCVVRGPFHPQFPHIPHQIVIEPKMAFGTGHHETTGMMLKHIIDTNVTNLRVLDMGCGTGILGILASMRGASDIVGIDIDQWSVDNTIENCSLNGIHNMSALLGDAALLNEMAPFDLILANINRNILLEDIKHYVAVLKPGGSLIMSGFYADDLPLIQQEAEKNNLHFVGNKEQNKWVAALFTF